MDTSDRVIVESNHIECLADVIPHGNSISGYDWGNHASSRYAPFDLFYFNFLN